MPRQHRGFTLTEVMIALSLGLVLMLGIVTLLSNVSKARGEIDKSSQQIENGRYATQLLSDDLRHAGYYDFYISLPAIPSALPDPCLTTATALSAALPMMVQGYNAPSTSPLSCLDNANFVSGTDILVIRRAGTTSTDHDDLVQNRAYIQSQSVSEPIVGIASDDLATNQALFDLTEKDGTTLIAPREYVVHIYFISPCSVGTCGTDSTDTIPTLKRIELTSAGMTTVSLVEGVENMQIEYGIDNTPSTVNLGTEQLGDGSPDTYTTAPANTTDWSNVVAARIYLLVRNSQFTVGYDDNKTYTLGSGITGTVTVNTSSATVANDFKRHVFTGLARIVNRSSIREIP